MRFLIFVEDLLQFCDHNNCQNCEDNMLLELRGASNIHFITAVPRAITQIHFHVNLTRGKLVICRGWKIFVISGKVHFQSLTFGLPGVTSTACISLLHSVPWSYCTPEQPLNTGFWLSQLPLALKHDLTPGGHLRSHISSSYFFGGNLTFLDTLYVTGSDLHLKKRDFVVS